MILKLLIDSYNHGSLLRPGWSLYRQSLSKLTDDLPGSQSAKGFGYYYPARKNNRINSQCLFSLVDRAAYPNRGEYSNETNSKTISVRKR
eukprot:6151514-Amphidinium_carterae.1